jgi:hypothetical protein
MDWNWLAQIGNRGAVAMAHGRRRRRPILVTGGERGGENGRDARRRLGGLILGVGERENS